MPTVGTKHLCRLQLLRPNPASHVANAHLALVFEASRVQTPRQRLEQGRLAGAGRAEQQRHAALHHSKPPQSADTMQVFASRCETVSTVASVGTTETAQHARHELFKADCARAVVVIVRLMHRRTGCRTPLMSCRIWYGRRLPKDTPAYVRGACAGKPEHDEHSAPFRSSRLRNAPKRRNAQLEQDLVHIQVLSSKPCPKCVYATNGGTWSMLMMSLVRDGSERPPTATVDEMLRSVKRTSVVATGAPTLRQ